MKKKPMINIENTDLLYDAKFLKLYDLRYAEGRHYFEASRRKKEDLVGLKSDGEFKEMLPDAVTVAVVLHLQNTGETKLLMSYEYRYPVGQFQLSPVAGLVDEEDRNEENPLISAAIREIKEESGLTVKPTDKVYVVNPCAFSSPGMTDESNAFLCAEITVTNLDELNQNGAVGGELFDGFVLLGKEEAKKVYTTGRDEHGNFFSLAAWAVIGYFLTM